MMMTSAGSRSTGMLRIVMLATGPSALPTEFNNLPKITVSYMCVGPIVVYQYGEEIGVLFICESFAGFMGTDTMR